MGTDAQDPGPQDCPFPPLSLLTLAKGEKSMVRGLIGYVGLVTFELSNGSSRDLESQGVPRETLLTCLQADLCPGESLPSPQDWDGTGCEVPMPDSPILLLQ